MFQPSEGSQSQQRSRFQMNLLPKIGSANPEVNQRMKQTLANPNSRGLNETSTDQKRGRHLSTAQPTGFKFSS